MKWIKITPTTFIHPYKKLAFMTNHIMFPDNVYFGIMTEKGNFNTYGHVYEPSMVTHYFYVEEPEIK